MADATQKPDLGVTLRRVQRLCQYFWEIAARTRAVGSDSLKISLTGVQEAADKLTGVMMDLEAVVMNAPQPTQPGAQATTQATQATTQPTQ